MKKNVRLLKDRTILLVGSAGTLSNKLMAELSLQGALLQCSPDIADSINNYSTYKKPDCIAAVPGGGGDQTDVEDLLQKYSCPVILFHEAIPEGNTCSRLHCIPMAEPLHSVISKIAPIIMDHREKGSGEQFLFKVSQQSDRTYNRIYNKTPIMMHTVDMHNKLQAVNDFMLLKTGYRRKEIIGKDLSSLVHKKSAGNLRMFFERIQSEGYITNVPVSVICKDGSVLDILSNAVISTGPESEKIEVHAYSIDVSEQRRMQTQIEIEKERFSRLFNNARSLIYRLRIPDAGVEYINPVCKTVTGYSLDDFLKGTVSIEELMTPDTKTLFKKQWAQMCEGNCLPEMEFQIITRDGLWRTLRQTNVIVFDEEGAPLALEAIANDITEKVAAKEALKEQNKVLDSHLKDKELVLKEVHHRINNNLGTIKSLAQLQISNTQHKPAKEALEEIRGRIHSIMILYSKLYQTTNYMSLSPRAYLTDLAGTLVDIFADLQNVTLNTDIENVDINLKLLFPLGLITNEILTNSLKYAFNKKTDNVIEVKLYRKGYRTTYILSDNGKGMPDFTNPECSSNFGLTLIAQLARQIEATMDVDTKNGTRYKFEFGIDSV